MAVGVLLNLPGITQEQYEEVNTKLFGQFPMKPDQAPDGCLMDMNPAGLAMIEADSLDQMRGRSLLEDSSV